MFLSRKRVFAGKQNLKPEPFCPYLTNESGYASLRRSSRSAIRNMRPIYAPRPRW